MSTITGTKVITNVALSGNALDANKDGHSAFLSFSIVPQLGSRYDFVHWQLLEIRKIWA
jgi:hypothetical protein